MRPSKASRNSGPYSRARGIISYQDIILLVLAHAVNTVLALPAPISEPERSNGPSPFRQTKGPTRGPFVWRRERDSNPRYTFWAYAPLAGECLRPLGHLSGQARDCTFRPPASSNQFHCEIRSLRIADAKLRATLLA